MADRIVILRHAAGHDPIELPFSWQDLPRRECPPGGHRALSSGLRWSTRRPDGREVRLAHLHQYLTYGGALCGLPGDDEIRAWPIEGAVRMALDLHPILPWTLTVLPPEILTSVVTRRRDGQRIESSIDFLPPVCCIGSFASSGECAVAVWFQRAFGVPEPGWVTDRIREIAWEDMAYQEF